MILTEGPSDRKALTGFFTDLYSMIDEEIEVFFPILTEDSISEDNTIERKYNGDLTSRTGINPDNVLSMILKLFIHPELKKHPAYEYPASVMEVIHLVDIDGVYLNDENVVTASIPDGKKYPFYDQEGRIITDNIDGIIDRNKRKRENLQKMIETKRLRITMTEGKHDEKEKPYKVYYFSSNLDHVLFGDANNDSFLKVPYASKFGSAYYGESLKLANYFLNHHSAVRTNDYMESWNILMNNHDSLPPTTNNNLLVSDLLKRAKIQEKDLPYNDIDFSL